MNKALRILVGLATVLAAATLVAVAADPPQPQGKLNGEVVAIRQHTELQNAGETMEIRVQTRNRQQQWVRLGPASEFGDAVRVGDRVRLRTMAGPDGDTPLVQAMQNVRTGQRIQVRDGGGDMIRRRDRIQDGTGAGNRTRAGQLQGGARPRGAGGGAGGRGRGR